MANHVISTVEIEQGNEAAHKVLADYCERIDALNKGNTNCFELWEDTQALYDASDWSTLMDEIGAKWAHIFDYEETRIQFESAWGYPMGAIQRIVDDIIAADDKAIVSMYYEDEMPNFIGAVVYAKDYDEALHIDEEDYHQHGLKFWWDEEEEGREEPEDFEATWDEGWEIREKFVSEDVKWINDELFPERDEEEGA